MTAPAVATTDRNPAQVPVHHVVKGETVTGSEVSFGSGARGFTTPALDLDALVWPRVQAPPAADVPLTEIIDLLVETGRRLASDPDGLLAAAADAAARTGTLPRDLVERCYAGLPRQFDARSMRFQVEQELGGADVVDGWREITDAPSGRRHRIRAFPPRLVHILAGNSPGVSAMTVVRGALTKGVHLLKLPSNDLFTAPAILRTMAAIAPGHPLVRSFSAVYWRGGDERVESALFRPQFFDKLVAWGGEAALRSAHRYLGPGFELVGFDPKTSISLIGREAFDSAETLADAADRAAEDATAMNQQACSSSRFQFVEGTVEQVDRFCEELQRRLGVERATCSAVGSVLPAALREELDSLRDLEGLYRVWGDYGGAGVVVRSDEPVDFHPNGRVVNVVPIRALADGVRHAGVATQTVGVFPADRKAEIRDALATAGVQRVVTLGGAVGVEAGLPHDGFMPLHRFVRWVNDEG